MNTAAIRAVQKRLADAPPAGPEGDQLLVDAYNALSDYSILLGRLRALATEDPAVYVGPIRERLLDLADGGDGVTGPTVVFCR